MPDATAAKPTHRCPHIPKFHGWSAITASYGGIKRADLRNLVKFSPACSPPAQGSLDPRD